MASKGSSVIGWVIGLGALALGAVTLMNKKKAADFLRINLAALKFLDASSAGVRFLINMDVANDSNETLSLTQFIGRALMNNKQMGQIVTPANQPVVIKPSATTTVPIHLTIPFSALPDIGLTILSSLFSSGKTSKSNPLAGKTLVIKGVANVSSLSIPIEQSFKL